MTRIMFRPLKRVDFAGAELEQPYLVEAYLESAVLTVASLGGGRIEGARLK